jgi:hypothetical protein
MVSLHDDLIWYASAESQEEAASISKIKMSIRNAVYTKVLLTTSILAKHYYLRAVDKLHLITELLAMSMDDTMTTL